MPIHLPDYPGRDSVLHQIDRDGHLILLEDLLNSALQPIILRCLKATSDTLDLHRHHAGELVDAATLELLQAETSLVASLLKECLDALVLFALPHVCSHRGVQRNWMLPCWFNSSRTHSHVRRVETKGLIHQRG